MALWSDTEGVVVGGDYEDDASSEGNVALTSDGGSTWSRPDGDPPGGYRSGVTVVAAGAVPTLVAVGTSGSDISTDGGRSWSELDATGFHTVAASPDGTVVWAGGSEGRVARLRR